MRTGWFVVARIGVVSLAVSVCAFVGSAAAEQGLDGGDPPAPSGGNLAVQAQMIASGGAAPPPGIHLQPSPRVARGAVIDVRPEGSDPSAAVEQIGDDQGQVTFSLPAGVYWAYLPFDNQNPDFSAAQSTLLADGTRVYSWAEVVVPAGDTATSVLTFTVQVP